MNVRAHRDTVADIQYTFNKHLNGGGMKVRNKSEGGWSYPPALSQVARAAVLRF